MPSGREYHSPQPFQPPLLDADILSRMRAPPDPGESAFTGNEEDSDGEETYGASRSEPVGAFPSTRDAYAGGTSSSTSYY